MNIHQSNFVHYEEPLQHFLLAGHGLAHVITNNIGVSERLTKEHHVI